MAMRFFFTGILDQAAVNSCILYNFLSTNETNSRRSFLKTLCLQFIKPHLQDRVSKTGLSKTLLDNISNILQTEKFDVNVTELRDKMEKRKRCYYCSKQEDKKMQYCCAQCKKPICENHRFCLCVSCVQ